MAKINSEMLILAREYRGLTQQELAQRIGIKQPQLAKIEAGAAGDGTEFLIRSLSEKLGFPTEFFFLTEVRVGFGSSAFYYRKRSKLGASDRKKIHSLVNLLRINIKQMLDFIELDPVRKLPRLPIEENEKTPQAIARAVRAFWRIPDGPISNVTALIEGAGIIVVPCDFGTPHMDGTGLWLNDMPPMIFINRNLPGDRWRFTLCHELAHFVMHGVPHEEMEEEADQFAAELLMPEMEIRAEFARLKPLRFTHFVGMKPFWKVSIAALLMRAREFGFINDYQYRRLWVARGSAGGNTEPAHIELERVQNFTNVLSFFKNELKFGVSEFKALLKINPPELESLYGVSDAVVKPKSRLLRLVQ